MKKILYSEMDSLGSIVNIVAQNTNIKDGMKKATLFKFWKQVVGKKFETVSEIASLSQKPDKTILTVACANAAVTSELTMFKSMLIKKINNFSTPLGIKIDDIIFSHKIWSMESNINTFENKTQVLTENPYKENLDGFNPETIKIDKEEIELIKINIGKNTALTKNQKERLLNSIIKDLKIQKFLKSK